MMKLLRRALVSLAVLGTGVGLFYAEENFRGKRAWEKYRQELESHGDQLDWKSFIPKPVPDDQNFAMTPLIQSSFSQLGRKLWKDDNYERAAKRVTVDKDHRQLTDLVAWARAYEDTNSNQRAESGRRKKVEPVESGRLDLESRANAAP